MLMNEQEFFVFRKTSVQMAKKFSNKFKITVSDMFYADFCIQRNTAEINKTINALEEKVSTIRTVCTGCVSILKFMI